RTAPVDVPRTPPVSVHTTSGPDAVHPAARAGDRWRPGSATPDSAAARKAIRATRIALSLMIRSEKLFGGNRPAARLEAEMLVEFPETVRRLGFRRDHDRNRRAALALAPVERGRDEAPRNAALAQLRQHIEIAHLAQPTPFHIQHGRHRHDTDRRAADARERRPMMRVIDHAGEVRRDLVLVTGKPF